MLRTLYIRDYALIEELEVAFEGGLNVITGETGAGKSILIGALKLILGERATTEMVRSGARKAVIEAVFDECRNASLLELLSQNEIEGADELIVRREVSPNGSRAFINDTPVPVGVLKEVSALLIDLHGQHDNQSLLRPDMHGPVLDDFGGLGPAVIAYRGVLVETQELVRRRRDLLQQERDLARSQDHLAYQIEEIDKIKPQPGEEELLEAERRVLENAEELFESTARLYNLLFDAEQSVHDGLAGAVTELQDLTRIDEAFAETRTEIQSAQIAVAEAARFLQDYNARIEFNPERLEEIRDRLGAFDTLKRKYGGSIEAVLRHREEVGRQYELVQDFQGALDRLAEEIEAGTRRLTTAALDLSARRKEIAGQIETSIVQELAALGIPHSTFKVRFGRSPSEEGLIRTDEGTFTAHPSGVDVIEFLISTNQGEEPRPLARVASGGEISRIMLALKTILAKSERLPILVFDEIDTGISGRIARKVGEALHDLGAYHQIIAITHHAQIAALGSHHYVVAKSVSEGRTRTTIHRVEGDQKAREVASLISGEAVTEAALESARELMSRS